MTQVTIPIAVGGSGIVYSDDGTGARDMTNGGHRAWLLPMLGEAVAASGSAGTSATSAANSAASTLGAASTQATSTTSLTIGTGTQSLTVQTGKNFVAGMPVRISSTASPTDRMDGSVTSYNSGTGALVVNVTATNGSGTVASWNVMLTGTPGLSPVASIPVSARTSNTILGTADRATLVDITSGTFTQTFTACATLAAGWYVRLRNSGAGDITLDPNASETIDGLTSFIMYPGEVRDIYCDGTSLRSVVVQPYYRVFTASATWTKPPGYSMHGGLAWGAGGGGGRSSDGFDAGGGGGGACVPFVLLASAMGTTETVTIGAGGTAQTGSGSGGTGGNTTLGSLVTSYGGGGGGGLSGNTRLGGGGGGALSAGLVGTTVRVSGGQPAVISADVNHGFGGGWSEYSSAYGGGGGAAASGGVGASLYGGGGGGGTTITSGGASTFGGAGGAGAPTTNGTAGNAPGGGGGATRTGTTSGAGARGELRMWGII